MNVLINTMLDGEKFTIWLLLAAILPPVKICRCNNMPKVSALLALCEGNSLVTSVFPLQNRRQAIDQFQWNLNRKTNFLLMGKHLKMFSVKWWSSCPWDHELNVNYLRLHAQWSVLEPRPVWFLGLDSLCIRLPRLSLLHPQIHGNKDMKGDQIFNPWNPTISDDSSWSILQDVFIMECLEGWLWTNQFRL